MCVCIYESTSRLPVPALIASDMGFPMFFSPFSLCFAGGAVLSRRNASAPCLATSRSSHRLIGHFCRKCPCAVAPLLLVRLGSLLCAMNALSLLLVSCLNCDEHGLCMVRNSRLARVPVATTRWSLTAATSMAGLTALYFQVMSCVCRAVFPSQRSLVRR